MRKNMIMLCSALSFAMAATDDACAMVSKVVYGIGIETAKASTLGLIIDLETAAEGKLAGDMITIRVRTEGGGERPSVECPVLALKRFVLLLKEEKIIVEEPSGAYYSLLGSFLPSVILSAFLFPCKISIPETCVS
jgi:hypothetical protein